MAKAKREKDKETNFEADLESLEGIVNALEEGGLSLDDSLKRFEEGIQLARRCEKALTEAEKRIEILLKNADGDLEAQPFGEGAAAPAQERSARRKEEKADDSSEDEDDEVKEPDEEDGELLF